ncbi:protein-S-isoprenylcysteine O-methyltransferase Ste14 [Skermanella aerolata]|uniref:methyltransferase family protein n=1 Tax=Skermanella aerolata TaxID=393310 RepID=UPI003D1EBFE9
MTSTTDKAGVIAPPPLLFAGAVAIGLALHHWVFPIGFGLSPGIRYASGGLLIVAALAIALSAIRLFGKAGTHVEPWKPSTALVTSGVYRYTRNPMYLGMALMHVGLSLIFDSVTLLLMLVPFLVVIRYGVIAREERYLTSKFPIDYPAFQKRVRRWF